MLKVFLALLSVPTTGAGTEQTEDDRQNKCLKSQSTLSAFVEFCEESSNNLLLCHLLALPSSNRFSGELLEEKLTEQQQ